MNHPMMGQQSAPHTAANAAQPSEGSRAQAHQTHSLTLQRAVQAHSNAAGCYRAGGHAQQSLTAPHVQPTVQKLPAAQYARPVTQAQPRIMTAAGSVAPSKLPWGVPSTSGAVAPTFVPPAKFAPAVVAVDRRGVEQRALSSLILAAPPPPDTLEHSTRALERRRGLLRDHERTCASIAWTQQLFTPLDGGAAAAVAEEGGAPSAAAVSLAGEADKVGAAASNAEAAEAESSVRATQARLEQTLAREQRRQAEELESLKDSAELTRKQLERLKQAATLSELELVTREREAKYPNLRWQPTTVLVESAAQGAWTPPPDASGLAIL
uniref:Uncharacterized protein n=1 Tax=Calcidiscus leptoporus TaxID=127549 RepID=A0A7S0IRE9_9EUKA|mmetsp:Transcript_18851/g.43301  ORF Transcript_18851/g.43301 Transcript_18851/m.43301 type:complete len:324 (+) Transcript_18851:123-1094(+)